MSTVAIRCVAMVGADPECVAKDLTLAGFNCQSNMICKVDGLEMEYFHDADTTRDVHLRYLGDLHRRQEFQRDPDKERRHG